MLAPPQEAASRASLAEYRRRIEQADRLLVAAIALRLHTVSEIQAWKREHGVPGEDRAQEREVLRRGRAFALANEIPPELAELVIQFLLREGKRLHLRDGASRPYLRVPTRARRGPGVARSAPGTRNPVLLAPSGNRKGARKGRLGGRRRTGSVNSI